MSFGQGFLGKSVTVQIEKKSVDKMMEQIFGKDWLDIDQDNEIETNINTKVWFRFNRKTKKAWMEVAI